jgi:hypothetical protein
MDILDILNREWPLIVGAPVLAIGGGVILFGVGCTFAWRLKSSIDDGQVRARQAETDAYKAQVALAKQREAVAKEKQDELEKQVADLETKIAANTSRAEVDESFEKVTIALGEAKAANNAVNYVLNAEPGEFKMIVKSFMIENEFEADDYLRDLLAKHEYRSMNEVNMRAQKYIKDEHLKNYFINKARGILKNYGHEIE